MLLAACLLLLLLLAGAYHMLLCDARCDARCVYSRRANCSVLPRLGLVAAQDVHRGRLPVDKVEGELGAEHGCAGRE